MKNLFKFIIAGYLFITCDIHAQITDKAYFEGSYPSNHWALQPRTLREPNVIALAYYKGHQYGVYLNPTDKRGYRSLVCFIKNDDMASTHNREYTSQEKMGMALTVHLVSEAYNRIVPIAQTAVAGNNAHKFDSQTGITFLGKAEEPSILHTHIIGRGNPEHCYIEDVKLGGPVPGLGFDMFGKTPHELGNESKVKWKNSEVEKVVSRFKAEIESLKQDYIENGLLVITQ